MVMAHFGAARGIVDICTIRTFRTRLFCSNPDVRLWFWTLAQDEQFAYSESDIVGKHMRNIHREPNGPLDGGLHYQPSHEGRRNPAPYLYYM